MTLRITVVATSLVALAAVVPASTLGDTSASEEASKRGGSGPTKINKCRTIDKPGSYLVTRDIVASGGIDSNCIVIAADNVTLDLGGFTLSRATSLVATADNNVLHATVRNGTMTHCSTCINFRFGAFAVIENISFYEHNEAIVIGGGTIRNNIFGSLITAIESTGSSIITGNILNGGIFAGPESIITDNIVTGSEDAGISTGPGSVVKNNTVSRTFIGISAGEGSTVIGNTAHDNTDFDNPRAIGIRVKCPSAVIGNTATFNSTNLVLEGEGCLDVNNVAP